MSKEAASTSRMGRFETAILTRPASKVAAFCNQRGTAEQWSKEGENATRWTRPSCRAMKANAVRLQLHAPACNLANFLRTLALPDETARWSLTAIREKVVKIGAKVIARARHTIFQTAGAAVSRDPLRNLPARIDSLRPRPTAPCRRQRGGSAKAPDRRDASAAMRNGPTTS